MQTKGCFNVFDVSTVISTAGVYTVATKQHYNQATEAKTY